MTLSVNYTFPNDENPNQSSTMVIPFTFRDDEGTAVIPDAATWTLLDTAEAVVNSKEDQVITPAASVEVVLSGADLAVGSGSPVRYFLVEYTYDSDAGNDLPAKYVMQFTIKDLPGV